MKESGWHKGRGSVPQTHRGAVATGSGPGLWSSAPRAPGSGYKRARVQGAAWPGSRWLWLLLQRAGAVWEGRSCVCEVLVQTGKLGPRTTALGLGGERCQTNERQRAVLVRGEHQEEAELRSLG